eukprot:TRINITY_DN10993_c0_g2_i1.p1 TRINITY_DN10993_c0_g2~~TRINITY_DN10993_c0_g2_i1.p1  ORF type:complete len:404 (+),score=26.09 TRINITY_DN10993_c0_g2_i1:86-1213(+)
MCCVVLSFSFKSKLFVRNQQQLRYRTFQTTTCQASVPKTSFRSNSETKFAQILNGCWQLAGGHGTELFSNISQTLQAQYDAGFTTFDTADIYGPSEGILGEFVSKCRQDGKPTPEIFTKYVPNIFRGVPNKEQVTQDISKSIQALQMEPLDLVQLHWWDYSIPGMCDVGLHLMDLKEKGLIKDIGVTNLGVEAVQQLLDAGVQLVSNQVQFSLIDRRPLNGMLQLCEDNNIRLFTYGSLAGGLLSDKYVEQPRNGLFGKVKYSNVNLNTSSLKMYYNVINKFGGQELWRTLLLVLKNVSDEHNCSVANIALAWVMTQSRKEIVHPIIGLRKPVHTQDNLEVFEIHLSQENLEQIGEVLQQAQGPKGDIYSFERGT